MVCILQQNAHGVYREKDSYQIYTQYILDSLFHNVSIASSCLSCEVWNLFIEEKWCIFSYYCILHTETHSPIWPTSNSTPKYCTKCQIFSVLYVKHYYFVDILN